MRGENEYSRTRAARRFGTSPRTRGKHPLGVGLEDQPRNIPAHAGKTWEVPGHGVQHAEHPRARGENDAARA